MVAWIVYVLLRLIAVVKWASCHGLLVCLSTLLCSRLALGFDVDAFGEVTQIARERVTWLQPGFVAFTDREMLRSCPTTHSIVF